LKLAVSITLGLTGLLVLTIALAALETVSVGKLLFAWRYVGPYREPEAVLFVG
jgi:hypothetical protein